MRKIPLGSRVTTAMYAGRKQVRLSNGRWKAIGAVIAVHALLALGLISGLAGRAVVEVSDSLKTFQVLPDPLPPPEPLPASPKLADEAAAPPAPKAQPVPVVAPRPEVRLPDPPPIAAAPVAGQGSAPASGGALAGSGSGAGGSGLGTGGGGGGPQRIAGALRDSDYPRSAKRAGAQGSVAIGFVVRTDGRVEQCEILSSSGNDDLDATTCRLVEKRFRYRPARDGAGNPVAARVQTAYTWSLNPRYSARPY